jgi:hypothetical protein
VRSQELIAGIEKILEARRATERQMEFAHRRLEPPYQPEDQFRALLTVIKSQDRQVEALSDLVVQLARELAKQP